MFAPLEKAIARDDEDIDGWGENVDFSEEDVEELMIEINPAGLDLLLRY